jgi:UDP-glucuronate decarboxylase
MLSSPDGKGEVVNIGSTDEVRILDLANKICGMTGGRSKISFLPLPEDDPKRRRPDISKAKRLLGWQPKINLDEGLKRTIDWFSSSLTHSW